MRQRKIVLDGTLCFILLRLCYNRLREEWYPGGYPPRAEGSAKLMQRMPGERSPAGKRLLQVVYLTCPLASPFAFPLQLDLPFGPSLWILPLDLSFGPSICIWTFPLHLDLPFGPSLCISRCHCCLPVPLPLLCLCFCFAAVRLTAFPLQVCCCFAPMPVAQPIQQVPSCA